MQKFVFSNAFIPQSSASVKWAWLVDHFFTHTAQASELLVQKTDDVRFCISLWLSLWECKCAKKTKNKTKKQRKKVQLKSNLTFKGNLKSILSYIPTCILLLELEHNILQVELRYACCEMSVTLFCSISLCL